MRSAAAQSATTRGNARDTNPCDGQGRPMSLWLTARNVNDVTELPAVLAGIRVPRPGPGRPRTRPDMVVADKGYSSPTPSTLTARGIKVVIPEKDDQLANRAPPRSEGWSPLCVRSDHLSTAQHRRAQLNVFKNWRGLASRYDKTAANYLGGLVLASALIWAGS